MASSEVPIPKHRTACDACKRMKIRCEWDNEGACHRCTARQIECSVTAKERKKREKKGHSSSDSYLAALEERLKRMESMIAKSSISSESGDTPRSPEEVIDSPAGVADKLSILSIGDNGVVKFVGSSSGFSIFSPSGLRWISQVTGNSQLSFNIAQTLKSDEPCGSEDDLSSPALWQPLADHERMPLPPREVAEEYITTLFEGYNTIFHIYEEANFRARFERQYPVKPEEDPGWYAALNMVFALGCYTRDHVKDMHGELEQWSPEHFKTKPRNRLWWKWFRNASSLFINLQFRESSLLTVQAMTMMIFLLQTLPNPYPCMVVSGAALRIAQSIGLHRHFEDGLTPADVEQRRNTFWALLVMERGMTMRAGRPSLINDDDIGCDLPKHRTDSPQHYTHLRYTAELTLIVGKCYNRLYSAKASSLTTTERLKWVGALDEELLRWRDSVPEFVRPDQPIQCEKPLTIPVLMLHFNYYNALTLIHRSGGVMYSTSPLSAKEAQAQFKDANINPRVYSSGAICVNAARSTINLLKNYQPFLPPNGVGMMRIIEYFPLVSTLALFANILQHPRDPQVLTDIELMEGVVHMLCSNQPETRSPKELRIFKVFQEVNRLATIYVQKARSQAPLKSKRGRDEGEEIRQDMETATSFSNPFANLNPAFSPPPLVSYSSIDSEVNPFQMPSLSTTTSNSNSTFSPKSNSTDPSTDPSTLSSYDTTLAPDPMLDDSLFMNMNGGDYFLPGEESWFFPMPSFIGSQTWGSATGASGTV